MSDSRRDDQSDKGEREQPEDRQSQEKPSSERRLRPSRMKPELEWHEVRPGLRPGERIVRRVRPHARYFRRVGPAHLVATERVLEPTSGFPKVLATLRRVLIGPPLTTAQLPHERISKVKALAVFASDAISSSAYATEAMLTVLVLAGSAAIGYTLPLSALVLLLLAIVVSSYRQTVRAFPQGGGSYIVAKHSLGTAPALLAAASLLMGYLLTVAVSISAGVAAVTSALPQLHDERVLLAVGFIAFMTIANLRGVRESATIFTAPTYLFVASALVMIGLGVFQWASGAVTPAPASEALTPVEPLSFFLLLRAFAIGSGALTGTEAIADGVPAFKEPQWKNAATTLVWMGLLLGILFFGVSFLAVQLGITPKGEETVISQIARTVFGTGPAYYFMQAMTTLILILAANTAFADFPRLSYFLARDRFLPTQFMFRGERLAFSTGILVLGLLSAVLVVAFRAETIALLPLYAAGVFIAFTTSQSSMVKRWYTLREPGWQRSLAINAIGAMTTGVVTVVVIATQFAAGAWIVLIIIPNIMLLLLGVNRHYRKVAEQLAPERVGWSAPEPREQPVIVPIADINAATLRSLAFARSISPNVTAVHVTDDLDEAEQLRQKWERCELDHVPLVILESPYRALIQPLLTYIDAIDQQDPEAPVTVVLTEFVPKHWWEWMLHNQSALRLKLSLFFRPNTIVVDVPYHLER